jgi:pyruvate/2-oxoglutarate/acetoin dehydrogenase E1 component
VPEKEVAYGEALREALREEMVRNEKLVVMGEDITIPGVGLGAVTKGLLEEFGSERVRDTPMSESAIVGSGVGAALTGIRAMIEVRWADFLFVAMDQVANQAAKMRYMSGAQANVPVVFRQAVGAGLSAGPHHSQSPEAIFMHIPGLKVALPSTPYDAKGLLKTALRDDNPVLFFEHKSLYRIKGMVPDEEYVIPFGQADIKKKGKDVTIVATLLMLHKSLRVAKEFEDRGISVEVVDPRTLVPLDKQTIINSVRRTGRLIIVSEDCKTGGVGAEIAAIAAEEAFAYLKSPVKRVSAIDTPIPFSPVLEKYVIPDEKDIAQAVLEVIK